MSDGSLVLSRCPECGLQESPTRPSFEREDFLCYAKADGRSRRSERHCYIRTIRNLRKRVAELENELESANVASMGDYG